MNAKPNDPYIQLWRRAFLKPAISKSYHTKSETCDKKNGSGSKRRSRCAYMASNHNTNVATKHHQMENMYLTYLAFINPQSLVLKVVKIYIFLIDKTVYPLF